MFAQQQPRPGSQISTITTEEEWIKSINRLRHTTLSAREIRNVVDREDDVDAGMVQKELEQVEMAEELKKQNKIVSFMDKILMSNYWKIVLTMLIILDTLVVITEVIIDMVEYNKELAAVDCHAKEVSYYQFVSWTPNSKDFTNIALVESCLARSDSCFSTETVTKKISHPHITPPVKQVYCSLYYAGDHGDSSHTTKLKTALNILHLIGISLMSVFALDALLRIILYRLEYLKDWHQTLDALVISTSLVFETILYVTHNTEVFFMIILLALRISRIILGIMRSIHERNEFKIYILKKSRDTYKQKYREAQENERFLEKEISSLQSLCSQYSVPKSKILDCVPKRNLVKRPTIKAGLSNISLLTQGMAARMFGSTNTISDPTEPQVEIRTVSSDLPLNQSSTKSTVLMRVDAAANETLRQSSFLDPQSETDIGIYEDPNSIGHDNRAYNKRDSGIHQNTSYL